MKIQSSVPKLFFATHVVRGTTDRWQQNLPWKTWRTDWRREQTNKAFFPVIDRKNIVPAPKNVRVWRNLQWYTDHAKFNETLSSHSRAVVRTGNNTVTCDDVGTRHYVISYSSQSHCHHGGSFSHVLTRHPSSLCFRLQELHITSSD